MKGKWFILILGLVLIGTTTFAADGDMIVNGQVGVGTASPASKLDVNGDVRVGNSSATCAATNEGAMRYNATSKAMEFCNATGWIPFAKDTTTKLLLHFNGTSGSTTITDSSYSLHAITANGTAQISTASPKFGSGSLYLDGSGHLTSPYNGDFYFGGDDFTIDFWIKRADQSGFRSILTNQNSGGYWGFAIDLTGSSQIRINNWNGQSADFDIYSPSITLNTGQWYHLAFVRSGSTITIYVDGTSVATGSCSGLLGTTSSELKIGSRYDNYPSFKFYGYLDEIRISKGIALWTSNFTPPTAPY